MQLHQLGPFSCGRFPCHPTFPAWQATLKGSVRHADLMLIWCNVLLATHDAVPAFTALPRAATPASTTCKSWSTRGTAASDTEPPTLRGPPDHVIVQTDGCGPDADAARPAAIRPISKQRRPALNMQAVVNLRRTTSQKQVTRREAS